MFGGCEDPMYVMIVGILCWLCLCGSYVFYVYEDPMCMLFVRILCVWCF